jgi:tocopherol O-methyltransferase
MKKQNNRKVVSASYYNAVFNDYNSNYSNEHIHYGFWFSSTKNHEESLENTIIEVLKYLNLQNDDIVLDVGCGSGGSCRYIINKFNVYIVGITLSEVLLKAAVIKSSGLTSHNYAYLLNDFHETSFKKNTFNKIYAIESICYSENIPVFCNESVRILKEGGKIVIADFFKKRYDLDEEENKIYREWLDGWAMPDITTADNFINDLYAAGYKIINFYNVTDLIQNSIEMIYDQSKTRLIETILKKNTIENKEYITNHLISGCHQKDLFNKNIITYGIIEAIK